MRLGFSLLALLGMAVPLPAQDVHRDIPYVKNGHKRQILDVYSPPAAKNRPVIFWIHGGGWMVGDKTDVQIKPKVFTEKGFVFVSTNYRFYPTVEMQEIIQDVAKAFRWTHEHIAEYGGDPNRIFVMGHSAGAQLAAILCTDDRYLQAENLTLKPIRGCVPVDGDTYYIPAIITTAETRWKAYGLAPLKNGHREKFGNDPAKHIDYSAVTHVAPGKNIPPFLILHIAGHPDVTAQAQYFAKALKAAKIPVTVFAARDTSHGKLNADLGVVNDPATQQVYRFLEECLKAR